MIWERLAIMLGVRSDQLDDALQDPKRARLQMTRRGLLAAGAAALGGAMLPKAAWSFPALPEATWVLGSILYMSDEATVTLKRVGPPIGTLVDIENGDAWVRVNGAGYDFKFLRDPR